VIGPRRRCVQLVSVPNTGASRFMEKCP
jgi:hypothetical protein